MYARQQSSRIMGRMAPLYSGHGYPGFIDFQHQQRSCSSAAMLDHVPCIRSSAVGLMHSVAHPWVQTRWHDTQQPAVAEKIKADLLLGELKLIALPGNNGLLLRLVVRDFPPGTFLICCGWLCRPGWHSPGQPTAAGGD